MKKYQQLILQLFVMLSIFCFPAYAYAESTIESQVRLANEFTTPPCAPTQNANLTISNGSSAFPITLGTSSRTAGAISSLKINGLETVNDDDLGREIQYAFQIGGGGEGNNPTEAGSETGISSHFIEGCATTTQLNTKSQMAYWRTYNGRTISDYYLTKKVELGYQGNPNLIRFAARIDIPEASSRLDIEIPTGYHSDTFRQISLYNPQTHTIRASVPSDFVHNLWNVFTDAYMGELTPILSDGTYSLFPYSSFFRGGIGIFYGYAALGNTTKWSISHTYLNPQAGGSYYLESYLLVATPNTVAPLIESLVSRYPPLTTITPTPTPKPGDANGDGVVDGQDYIIWLNRYNQATSNDAKDGDFNRDGKIDGLDYVIWLNNYES